MQALSLVLTTADEAVYWHLFTTPRTITVEQLEPFADITLGANPGANVVNNRIIQPLNGRSVYSHTASA